MRASPSLVASIVLGLSLVAFAEDKKEGEPSADVKACTGIEKRDPVGAATSFKKGDVVYVWSEVRGCDGKDVQHVWKRDGKELRKASFHVKSNRWRVNSRVPNAAPGSYTVEVIAEDKKIGEAAFKVE